MALNSKPFLPSQLGDKVTPEQWEVLKGESEQLTRLFFTNVRYLMEKRGISLRKLKSDLREYYGIGISLNTIKKYCDGLYRSADTKYLSAYALYFNEPLIRLSSVDYSAEEQA